MNNVSPTPRRHRAMLGLAALTSLAVITAACGSDTKSAPATTTAAASAPAGSAKAPFGPACSAVPATGSGSFAGMAQDPAATAASNNPLLSTLVTAVTAAGLVDTLNGPGPFTIFAPVNDAFAAIPADQLKGILADKAMLTSILTYHVVAGTQYDAAALGKAGTLETVNGAKLTFSADGTMVNGAKVLCSDVVTANATVHIIDSVLVPAAGDKTATTDTVTTDTATTGTVTTDTAPAASAAVLAPSGSGCAAVPADGAGSFAGMAQDPAATAASHNPVLSTLVTAVSAAGLVDTLNGPGPFTIFAPLNDAFAAIPADQLKAILADKDKLTSILTYHVVAGEKMSSADLIKAGSVTTVNGGKVTITEDNGVLMVNGHKSVCMDIPTANATVHIIDTVLTP